MNYIQTRWLVFFESPLENFSEALRLRASDDMSRFNALSNLAQKQIERQVRQAITEKKTQVRGTVDACSLSMMRFYVVFAGFRGFDEPTSAKAVCSFPTAEQRQRLSSYR